MGFCEEGSYIYRLHFATPGVPSKIYILSLYRLSSNVGITKKSESLRTGENHFVACCLYVTFSSFSVLCHFFSLIREIFIEYEK